MSSTSAGGIAFQLRYFVQISPPKSPVCHSEKNCGLLATRREFICYLVRNTPSSGTKAPRPRCDSSGRPLEFVSISPCELILIKWPKSPVVCIINIIAAEHSPGFYTRFQIHLSSRCFDLTQRNTHNITRGELSERPSQSLNDNTGGKQRGASSASASADRAVPLPTADSNPNGTDGVFEVHAAVGRQLVLLFGGRSAGLFRRYVVSGIPRNLRTREDITNLI